jgi:hypothetical protein
LDRPLATDHTDGGFSAISVGILLESAKTHIHNLAQAFDAAIHMHSTTAKQGLLAT